MVQLNPAKWGKKKKKEDPNATFKGKKLTAKQRMRNKINKASREESAKRRAAHLEATKEHREKSRYERKHGRPRPGSQKAKDLAKKKKQKKSNLRVSRFADTTQWD